MIDTPWGLLPVADAHVHFFSHRFFASLAEQKGVAVDQLAPLLNWQLPAEDPLQLADACCSTITRHLRGDPVADPYYELLKQQVVNDGNRPDYENAEMVWKNMQERQRAKKISNE